jgi:hypothetical protein
MLRARGGKILAHCSREYVESLRVRELGGHSETRSGESENASMTEETVATWPATPPILA